MNKVEIAFLYYSNNFPISIADPSDLVRAVINTPDISPTRTSLLYKTAFLFSVQLYFLSAPKTDELIEIFPSASANNPNPQSPRPIQYISADLSLLWFLLWEYLLPPDHINNEIPSPLYPLLPWHFQHKPEFYL